MKYLVIVSLVLFSCSDNIKFDEKKWNSESDRGYYTYRNAMLEDLMENHHLKGKTINELEELFGYVEYDSTKKAQNISFIVLQEWGMIDPTSTKYLNLRLNEFQTVDSIFISEFKR